VWCFVGVVVCGVVVFVVLLVVCVGYVVCLVVGCCVGCVGLMGCLCGGCVFGGVGFVCVDVLVG
jgi:hypothetical protein